MDVTSMMGPIKGMPTRRAVLAALLASAAKPTWAKVRSSDVDVVVIGAGASGLAAGRALLAAGRTVVILEAAGRVGGRAFTESDTFSIPFDHGCSWLTGAPNLPLVQTARNWDFTLHGHLRARETIYVGNRPATRAEFAAYGRAWSSVNAALKRAGRAGQDVPASTVIPTDLEFSGISQTWIGPIDWGVDFKNLSTMDHWKSADPEINYMVKEGLGTLITRLARGLPIRLRTPVTEIDWSGSGVKVVTPEGEIRAKACIVTVSTGVLRAGSIRFKPSLPDWKQYAFDKLPMGLLQKVALQFDGERFGLRRNSWLAYWVPNEMPAEAVYFLTFPFDSDMMIGFFGGDFGWRLSREGEVVALDFAIGELVKMLGSNVRKHFVRGRMTGWADNPHILGAYAAAAPGHYGARAKLLQPIAERVYFAGEATAMPYVSLCGGAFLNGDAVGREVAETLP